MKRSVDFFTKLSFTFNLHFTDENATGMIIGENIFVMLIVESCLKEFTKKEVCDATKFTEILIAIVAASKAEVDELVKKRQKPAIQFICRTSGSWLDVRSQFC